jgi:hypothetical protein
MNRKVNINPVNMLQINNNVFSQNRSYTKFNNFKDVVISSTYLIQPSPTITTNNEVIDSDNTEYTLDIDKGKNSETNEIILDSETQSISIPRQFILETPFIQNLTNKSNTTIISNVIFEPVLIQLNGDMHSAGSITLDAGVWIITYGINFTTGSGDINGANIYRIRYGLSENTDTIELTNINDISQLKVVTFTKPFYMNGLVQMVTITEPKTYYLLGSILATGESLVFGGNISAMKIA